MKAISDSLGVARSNLAEQAAPQRTLQRRGRRPDTRWCSEGFEIGCDNGEKVRIAFTLDCCDREAISWVATTGGINSSDIRDLMIESVERRFGLVDKLPKPIEWLSDNGSP